MYIHCTLYVQDWYVLQEGDPHHSVSTVQITIVLCLRVSHILSWAQLLVV